MFYELTNLTAADPPCPANGMCYQSTVFDPVAYDRSRPDLGVDVAHLDWSPTLARWGQTLTIDATVFNAGWTASPETTAHFEIALADDSTLTTPLQADVVIPELAPRSTQEVTVELTLPVTPPGGYEAIEYVRLEVQVDPADTVAETTDVNNGITAPMMIQPLPTTAGLFLITRDITSTVRGGDEIPLNNGSAHLSGPGDRSGHPHHRVHYDSGGRPANRVRANDLHRYLAGSRLPHPGASDSHHRAKCPRPLRDRLRSRQHRPLRDGHLGKPERDNHR